MTDITQRWAVLSLLMAKRWPLNLMDMRSDTMDEAFSSPGLMAHYLSAARHTCTPDGRRLKLCRPPSDLTVHRTKTIMANHIQGPLYYERMGRSGSVMAFVHPNPLDQSCWLFQLAHFSTWFRCIAIDIPGYGRSPEGRSRS